MFSFSKKDSFKNDIFISISLFIKIFFLFSEFFGLLGVESRNLGQFVLLKEHFFTSFVVVFLNFFLQKHQWRLIFYSRLFDLKVKIWSFGQLFPVAFYLLDSRLDSGVQCLISIFTSMYVISHFRSDKFGGVVRGCHYFVCQRI